MISIRENVYRYGKSFNTHDFIKVVAIFIMVIDHVGYYLLANDPWFRMIGRIGLPMWYFLIGYVNKLRINYFLIGYGIILSFTDTFLMQTVWFNVLLTFIVCQVLLHYFPVERISTLWRAIFFLLLLPINALLYSHVEYGVLGIFLVYSARMVAIKDPQAAFWLALAHLVFFVWQIIAFPYLIQPKLLYPFAFLTLGVYFLLLFYKQRVWSCPQFLLFPMLFISRYSLHIYFYHLIALQLIWVLYITQK
ncbi:MAG: hypothetical protein JSR17_13930 [Proteobacteria bacterium]|nr:hypothetical protein [Pseudomonadota bacterium]